MPRVQQRTHTDLTPKEAREAIGELREILWEGGDPDHEWDVETIEHVADVLIRLGLRPNGSQH